MSESNCGKQGAAAAQPSVGQQPSGQQQIFSQTWQPLLSPENSVLEAIAYLQQNPAPFIWVGYGHQPQGYVTAEQLLSCAEAPDASSSQFEDRNHEEANHPSAPPKLSPASFSSFGSSSLSHRLDRSLGAIAQQPGVLERQSLQQLPDLIQRLQHDSTPLFWVQEQSNLIGYISRTALQQFVIDQLAQQLTARQTALPSHGGPSQETLLDPAQMEVELSYRVAFEALLTQISTRFLNLSHQELNQALLQALGETAEFTQCDRACIFQYSPSGTEASCCQEWHRAGLKTFDLELRSILRCTFPWSLEQMQRQATIHVPCLDNLPPAAEPERLAAQQLQAQSYVVIPLSFRGNALGWLAFYSVLQRRTWSPEDLEQLRAFGSIVAGVMARQQAETALLESEAKFEQLVENLQQIFFIYGTQPHRLLYISPSYTSIWDVPVQSLYDDPDAWLERVHPGDKKRVMAETERRRIQGLSIDLEYRVIQPNGSIRWIRSRAFPIRDDSGQVYRIAGIAEDVSERHHYEQALARSEEKFSKAFRLNPVPMAITVLESGQYLDVNDAFCTTLGFHRDELIGTTFQTMESIVEPRQLVPIHRQLLEQGSFKNMELHVRRRNGDLCITQSSGLRIDVDGQAQVLSISRDITQARQQEIQRQQTELALRQATQAAQQANQAKGDFLAMMSHEIRTPLNAIIGMTSLLLDEGLPQHQQQHLEMISNGAEELLVILNDILDLSKIEASCITLERELFDWQACLTEVLSLFQAQAQPKGIQLSSQMAPQLPSQCTGDRQRLRQVLSNLVGNAIKFTAQGNVTLSVQRYGFTQGSLTSHSIGDRLLFCISDTGIGIPSHAIETLFEPFNQADSSITRQYGGTGLGLTICDRLIQLMGGNLWMESQGQIGGNPPVDWALHPASVQPNPSSRPEAPGSRFYFTLPYDMSLPSPPGEASRPPSHIKLLLVEDVITNQKIARQLLAKLGYDIDTVGDGAAAIAALSRCPYDVIFLDLGLPQLNGYETCQQLQALPSATPWIIGLSGSVDQESRDRCYQVGMDDFLAKPIHPEALLRALERFWRHHQTNLSQEQPSPPGNIDRGAQAAPATGISSLSTSSTGQISGAPPPPTFLAPREPTLKSPEAKGLAEKGLAENSSPSPSLDYETFHELRHWCDDSTFFEHLLETYRNDAQHQLETIEIALRQQDSAGMDDVAHSLGPASATLGGLRLSSLCQAITALIETIECETPHQTDAATIPPQHHGAWEQLEALVGEMQQEYQSLEVAIAQQTVSNLPK